MFLPRNHEGTTAHRLNYHRFYSLFGYDSYNRPEFLFNICYLTRNTVFAMYVAELDEMNSLCEIADVLLEEDEDYSLP